ncbi:MAG: hypothetical protein ACPGVU_24235 [Limisphaerales bacterium]
MDDETEDGQPNTIPVPEVFWSFETEAPLRTCLVCSKNLIDSGEQYLIEKAFSKREVMFEYALCLPCHTCLAKELSENSMKLITNYFEEHVLPEQRRARISAAFDGTVQPWLSHCLVTHKPIREDDEYQIHGMCFGNELVLDEMPHAISGEALDAIMNLLSNQTKGFINDFTGKHFGVPTGADLPKFLPL